MNIPFVGPTYAGRSGNIDASRSINFYPETNPAGAKQPMSLVGTPGTCLWASLGAPPVRGMHVDERRAIRRRRRKALFRECGRRAVVRAGVACHVERKGADGGQRRRVVGRRRQSIDDSGRHGRLRLQHGDGHIQHNIGRRLSCRRARQHLHTSTAISSHPRKAACPSAPPTSTTALPGTPLPHRPCRPRPTQCRRFATSHQQLWIIKEYTSEVWYDAGMPTSQGFPFMPDTGGGARLRHARAPFGRAGADDSLFFLANQRNNDGGEFVGVVALSGIHAADRQARRRSHTGWASTRSSSDAFGYCYSRTAATHSTCSRSRGQRHVGLRRSTAMWHERSTWTGASLERSHTRKRRRNGAAILPDRQARGQLLRGLLRDAPRWATGRAAISTRCAPTSTRTTACPSYP